MALTPRRHRVGGTSADVTQSRDPETDAAYFAPATPLWAYQAAEGGARLTDLLDADGNPVTEIVSDANGQVPEFYTPAGVSHVYVAAGLGDDPDINPRVLLSASDLKQDIDALDAAIDGISVEAGVQSVNGVSPDGSGAVTLVPGDIGAAADADVQILLNRPATTTVVQVGAGFPPRPSWADVVHWVGDGTVDPGSSAEDGDEWHYPKPAGG